MIIDKTIWLPHWTNLVNQQSWSGLSSIQILWVDNDTKPYLNFINKIIVNNID